jgi:hypothetical protein
MYWSIDLAALSAYRRLTKWVIASQQTSVIPAEAGIHVATAENEWIPAFAGMTIGNLTTTHFGNAR